MGKIAPNENILKLRELTDKLCESPNDDYNLIIKKIQTIVNNGKSEADSSKTTQSKIKCYETMCATITNLITNISFK